MKMGKMYKFSVLRKVNKRDIRCNMINMIITVVCYIIVNRIHPKCPHHKKKIISISLILCLYEIMEAH